MSQNGVVVPALHTDVTEPIPRVGPGAPDRTKELPAVQDAPTAPSAPPPAPPSAPPPVPATGQAAPPASAARRRPTLSRRALLTLSTLAAVAAAGVGAILGGAGPGRDGSAPAAGASARAAVRIEATVSGVDPSGGSGLQRDGDGWRTQTYRSATFGNLKPGVGLLLDLGTARAVSAVTFDAGSSGATVGLRAADQPTASGADLDPVGRDRVATGRTVLDGSGAGAHRYWLVWVSELGPRDGGYAASFGAPVVTGPPTG
jgi:hypothetical protein